MAIQDINSCAWICDPWTRVYFDYLWSASSILYQINHLLYQLFPVEMIGC
jgi:hypothetical protein